MAVRFKLLVGLGNPTAQYDQTRHNAGFWFLDEVAARQRLAFQANAQFQGDSARWNFDSATVHLLKPMTYMNRSGQSVGALARYFRIEPDEILVAHDELDLSPGIVRLKRGGGHGGHNGLRDLIAHLGSADFYRLRFGIGHPGDRSAVIGYVLTRPSREEGELLRAAMARTTELLPEILGGRLEVAMNRLHSAPRGKTEG